MSPEPAFPIAVLECFHLRSWDADASRVLDQCYWLLTKAEGPMFWDDRQPYRVDARGAGASRRQP